MYILRMRNCMRPIRGVILPAVFALAFGCGDDPTGSGRVVLGGAVRDYFSSSGLPDVTVTYVDEGTALVGMSGPGGAYLFLNLHPSSAAVVTAALAGYRTTRSEAIALTPPSVSADLEIVATADVARQYTGVGRTPVAGTSAVFVTLRDASGQPHTGIPVADIALAPQAGGGPAGVGPFVFGASGDIVDNATLSVTTAFDGRARVAFLDVPPGAYTLTVTFTSGTVQTKTVNLDVVADGVTLVRR